MKQLMWDLISAAYIIFTIALFFGLIILGCNMNANFGTTGFSVGRGLGMTFGILVFGCICMGLYHK